MRRLDPFDDPIALRAKARRARHMSNALNGRLVAGPLRQLAQEFDAQADTLERVAAKRRPAV